MTYKEFINSDTTQLELMKIAISNQNEFIRGSAIRKLLDQPTLVKLADEDPNPFIRSEAALKITDQIKLAKIATSDIDPDVRRAAVGSIQDTELLKEICLDDSDDHVRENAVKQLTYECREVLLQVIRKDPNWMVRHAAVWKLKANGENGSILLDIGLNDPHIEVRKAAVEKLIDEEFIHTILMQEQSAKVRLSAMLKITNSDLLAEVAMKSKDDKIREIAVSKIDNQNLLKVISSSDKNRWVREQAVNNLIENQENLALLTNIAMQDPDENVRYTAVLKIKDLHFLQKVITESVYKDSVYVAISNIEDLETLVVLRMTTKPEIQKKLVERIQELQKLK